MVARILIGVLVVLGVLPTTATPTLQTNSNSISGHVSNDQRAPLADLRVELLNEVDSVIRTVKTDGSGLFVFRKLSDGTFHVRIQTSGTNYVSQTKRVELARPHGFGAAFEELDFVLVTNDKGRSQRPGVVFVQEVPEGARKQFEKGFELLNKSNKRAEAFAALKSAIDLFPQYFDALELLGTEQVKDREYEAAIPALTKALEVNSRAFASSFALGVAQYNLKQLEPAIEAFRRAVSLNERSINANLWLGIALRQTSRPQEAEPYLKRADVLADSKLPDAHWQLALLFNQLKRYKEAADELETFLKVQPDSKDAELIKKLIQRFRQQSVAEKP
jgi:tetratricopeptide (TPR) repeat protein